MDEAAASFTPYAYAAQDAERQREQADDVEHLLEKMIERLRRQDKELREAKAELDRVKEENEKLRQR
jgi:dsDNA-specific endonuclease/ATPase MutS2